jgi:hypothetical protein
MVMFVSVLTTGLVPGVGTCTLPTISLNVVLNSDTASFADFLRFPDLKGLTMDVRFLRHEAARFRGMADTADREATRLRFLAMAAEYDARANAADQVTEQTSSATETEPTELKLEEATNGLTQPDQGGALSFKPKGRIAREPKKTIVVETRPIGRQR